MFNLYDLSYPALEKHLQGWGFSPYHAGRIWACLYQEQVETVAAMTELRPDLQARLVAETAVPLPHPRLDTDSSDGFTRKFLLALADGQTIETVLMWFKGRATACVSTQVGCAMGCVFCATGQMGFTRHLTAGEIVGQVLFVDRLLQSASPSASSGQGQRLRNIVLMGMGEPLHNYEDTMTAVDILTHPKGLAIAPRHITLSTVGVVPGIIRLADEGRQVRLAVSLHGATDAERQALVPPARRWPLAELMNACRYYTHKRKRHIFFEWTLIEGKNDSPDQAHTLGQLLQTIPAHVNLIPLNPTPGYEGLPTARPSVKQFQAILTQYGIPSTVRQRRGIDIAAGCGQLKVASVK
ncbi:MAG TPA: 23S rRNA (adenine(2503)-C(2))-methyltransferase RlmN [Chloroflexota bacterium]|nr:23S rRNA (adenine(2503)-C(2))-methyltransferase RlmN [Chloroflexota bacterium]